MCYRDFFGKGAKKKEVVEEQIERLNECTYAPLPTKLGHSPL
jgi:hypothetical protein